MQGKTISAADVEELAKLPPFDVLRGQVLGVIVAPLQNLLGLLRAPLQNLVGLIDARIEQLGGESEAPAAVQPRRPTHRHPTVPAGRRTAAPDEPSELEPAARPSRRRGRGRASRAAEHGSRARPRPWRGAAGVGRDTGTESDETRR